MVWWWGWWWDVGVGSANTNTETKRPSDFTAPGQPVPTLPQHDNQDG